MRKFFALLLAGAVCLALAPAAFAGDGEIAPAAFSDIAGHVAEADLTLLAALGVMSGNNGLGGPARPDDPITRAEFCKLIVVAYGKEGMANALTGLRPDFVDEVPAWAWGYVNVAVYMGIINGYEDGTFRAGANLTYGEAVTMLVRAVPGHQAQVGAGVWPYTYIFYGVDKGFTGAVDVSFAGLPCSRGDMARLLVATLQVHQVDSKGVTLPDTAELFGRLEVSNGLTEAAGYDHVGNVYAGTLLWYGYDGPEKYAVIYYPAYDDAFSRTLADLVHVAGAPDLESLIGSEVWAVADADDEFIFVKRAEASEGVITGTFEELADLDDDGADDAILLTDGTEVPIPEGADSIAAGLEEEPDFLAMVLNQRTTPYTVLELFEPGGDALLAGFLPPELVITLGADGLAENIIGTTFTDAQWVNDFTASEVTATGEETDTQVGLWDGPDFEVPADCLVTLNGAGVDRDDLAAYDVVSVAYYGAPGWFLERAVEGLDPLKGPDYIPYSIRAHRQPIEGTVHATAAHWPGPSYDATIDLKDGTRVTYTINDSGGIDGTNYPRPAEDAVVRYGLDFAGNIFVPIGYATVTPYVLVQSFTTGTAGDFATVDVAGTATTYEVDSGSGLDAGDIGKFGLVSVASGTGEVTAFTEADFSASPVTEVLAVDAANETLTLAVSGGGVAFVTDPVLYRWDATTGSYVYATLDTVAVGWTFLREQGSGWPLFIQSRSEEVAFGDTERSSTNGMAEVTTDGYLGDACWQGTSSAKMELYFYWSGLSLSEELGTFTVDDIAEISFATRNLNATTVDFSLEIYTMPYVGGAGSWYGQRLTAEPYFTEGYSPANAWNLWSTGGAAALRFYDSNHTAMGWYSPPMPTLVDIQAGPITWSGVPGGDGSTHDYGSQTVKCIKLSTSNSWSGFAGYLDAITITLHNGLSVTVDLEG